MRTHAIRASILGSVLLVGCAPPTEPLPPPVLRIASDATFAPFHFLDASGRPTGYDIELARLVAERAGFAPEVIVRPYDDLLPGLESGGHDLVAATTGITPEREARYGFTAPYFATCQAVLARDEPGAPATIEALYGRRVGAAGEGTSLRALQALEGVTQVPLGKGQAGMPVLERGDIDALIVDEFDAVAAARASNGLLRVLAEPAALEHYAFVFALDRDDLKRRLDESLHALEKEGVVTGLRRRFGLERDETWPVRLNR